MTKHFGMVVMALLVVAVLVVATVAYQVDELTSIVLVKTFGKVTDVKRGSQEAGLHFKWPWPVQRTVHYDARSIFFEDTYTEVSTRDKQNILVTLYCGWRIQDPKKFHSSIERVDVAQDRLREIVRSAKKDVVGIHNMEDFINTDPSRMDIPAIEKEVLDLVRQNVQKGDYGIEVTVIGLKSLSLPEQVTQAVIDAMKEERQRDVKAFESAGEAQATAIKERARMAQSQILSFANRKAAEIRAEGDRAAAQYYKEFEANPELAMFLRSLESLRKELKSRSVIMLDGSILPAVRWFHKNPEAKDLTGLQQAPPAVGMPATAPVEKPAAAPAEKPVVAPAEKPVVAPTEKPASAPAPATTPSNPADKPADSPADKPTTQPATAEK